MNTSPAKRRTIVTGATGMLGRALIAQLAARGYEDITVLAREESRLDRLDQALEYEGIIGERPYKVIYTSLSNPFGLREALAGADLVFHCAAGVSFSDDASEVITANVEITAHMVDAALDCGVGLFVHVSSIATLGSMQDKVLVDEDQRLESLSGQPPYAQGKFLSENQVMRGQELGLPVIIVNPGVIIGEGEWRSTGSASLIPFITSGIPFYTTGMTGYVDVKDVARAMILLSEEPSAVGEKFILCGDHLSFRELISEGARAAGKPRPFLRAGKAMAGLAWRLDAWASRTFPGHRGMISRATANSSQSKNLYNGEKIKKFVNFDYSPLNGAIRRVVARYIEERNTHF